MKLKPESPGFSPPHSFSLQPEGIVAAYPRHKVLRFALKHAEGPLQGRSEPSGTIHGHPAPRPLSCANERPTPWKGDGKPGLGLDFPGEGRSEAMRNRRDRETTKNPGDRMGTLEH